MIVFVFVVFSLNISNVCALSIGKRAAPEALLRNQDGLDTAPLLDCYRDQVCHHWSSQYACQPSYSYVGYDRGSCSGQGEVQPICCRSTTIGYIGGPGSCGWKGDAPSCNAPGDPGQVVLFQSKTGGAPHNSDAWGGDDLVRPCETGSKSFVCPLPQMDGIESRCRVTPDCHQLCAPDEVEVAAFRDDSICGKRYCCKASVPSVSQCNWRGDANCDDNACDPNQVTVLRTSYGDSDVCPAGRQKSLCCTPAIPAPKEVCEECGTSACEWEEGLCVPEPVSTVIPDEPEDQPDPDTPIDALGPPRPFEAGGVRIMSKSYPSSSALFKGKNGQVVLPDAIAVGSSSCYDVEIALVPAATIGKAVISGNYSTEHGTELQLPRDFLRASVLGTLPSGFSTVHPPIPASVMNTYFNKNSLSSPYRPFPGSQTTRNPSRAMAEVLGSYANRRYLFLVSNPINARKALVFSYKNLVEPNKFQKYLDDSIATGTGEKKVIEPMREVYWDVASNVTFDWVEACISQVESAYRLALANGNYPTNWRVVQRALVEIRGKLHDIRPLRPLLEVVV
ncbi:hypothetical protein Cob_v004573 [Colletotrichum orbiculare MAFF 240422]|uniref:Uncharacterized protein n=1 Tax=Colletotrichum orbiculare (strain 104-T / ATCC 96160 / CBS 514.97 / LARS 414 / MAFF 240422) TaxID=1213857 RepID=N4V4Y7_COLOR|nr:hypothetical protein Cob_v004573 [Colletotrichum orbiculare MAFF 240422]